MDEQELKYNPSDEENFHIDTKTHRSITEQDIKREPSGKETLQTVFVKSVGKQEFTSNNSCEKRVVKMEIPRSMEDSASMDFLLTQDQHLADGVLQGVSDAGETTAYAHFTSTSNPAPDDGDAKVCPSPSQEQLSTPKKKSRKQSSSNSTRESPEGGQTPGRKSRQRVKKHGNADGDGRQSRDGAESESTALESARDGHALHCTSSDGGDVSFRPSLLEEVLAEKKMALLRSPEVMQFLQEHQKRIATERQQGKSACGPRGDNSEH